MNKDRLPVFVLALCAAISTFAQVQSGTPDEGRRIQQLAAIDSLEADRGSLQLPENRAIVSASLANHLWELDRKRADVSLQEAIGDLINARNILESEDRLFQRHFFRAERVFMDIRMKVLNSIAKRDADSALRELYASRPAKIERAMAALSSQDSGRHGITVQDRHLVHAEIGQEQRLVLLAAEQDPERAVKMLKEALKRGVGPETLGLLKKLHAKDSDAAKALAAEAIAKLTEKGFLADEVADSALFNTAINFINDHIRDRLPSDNSLRFPDIAVRSLADKAFSDFMTRPAAFTGYGSHLVTIASKLRPELTARVSELASGGPFGSLQAQSSPATRHLFSSNTPIEQVISEGSQLSGSTRTQVLSNAVYRLAGAGEIARAEQLVNDSFSENGRAQEMYNLKRGLIHHLIHKGEFAAAETVIDEVQPSQKIDFLIYLATGVFKANPVENRASAVRILQKALSLTNLPVGSSTEMMQTMRLLHTFIPISPDDAFISFDSLIGQMNEIISAGFVINSFNEQLTVRHGEFVVSNPYSTGIYFQQAFFKDLAKSDLKRTLGIIDRFSRIETRVMLKEYVVEGVMEKPK